MRYNRNKSEAGIWNSLSPMEEEVSNDRYVQAVQETL